MNAAVELQDLTLAYQRHPAIHHLNGHFATGSLTAIVGPNGAGKSTLLKAIAGTLRPVSGRIKRAVSQRRLGYLPQAAEIDRSFPLSVLETVVLGAWQAVGSWRGVSAAQREEARQALRAVGLDGLEERLVGTLSSGQFQRVLFARLLLQDAPVLLLDEPFTAIDARTTADLLTIVRRWHGQGRTVIAVLHDLDQVRQHFPETLLLAREAIAWGETAQVLVAENLAKARNLAEYWDADSAVCERV
ncbi:ABC transporter [Pseudomonas oryzihabitans]|uniref:zinc ABC transporter ATP-binding protein AztA n=1 Tax=Pseudomonas rhizoryzae TaxID=2571129 RepID=UPI0007362435|nr:zinc ABC transporter ATP-binding protein AztA [Pseudomonas rhizoryzae]APQ10497.1 ABC transporter [Pseudomonas psychrotolerans]KTS79198.1 ABC transporter [Pseudomonas psychrotolerans]KTS99390.1 ABC transporter [Pseudomonas psychrotolerans]KTT11261.1 ABC transporter [Pseudomonas psychrotolerans]KTT24633.1 ABC transporter [Pseudomonas psychrotolerans]